jgi:hypothetical protein
MTTYPGKRGDNCSKDGAQRIAQMIEDYWKAKGVDVSTRFAHMSFKPSMRSASVHVRSDMVNGLPRQLAERKAVRS